jgi:NADH:ubiquinone oxidoreductase subunit 4 (subunit M)
MRGRRTEMIIPEKLYQVMKWVALIVLPAVATFVGTIGTATGWDATGVAVTIIVATGTLLGAVIGVSGANFAKAAREADDDIKIGGTDCE